MVNGVPHIIIVILPIKWLWPPFKLVPFPSPRKQWTNGRNLPSPLLYTSEKVVTEWSSGHANFSTRPPWFPERVRRIARIVRGCRYATSVRPPSLLPLCILGPRSLILKRAHGFYDSCEAFLTCGKSIKPQVNQSNKATKQSSNT